MKVRDLLGVESIQLQGTPTGKEDAIRQMVDLMCKRGNIADPDAYLQGVFARGGLTNLSRRFFDEFVQEVRDVLRNRADLFFFGSDGDERLDGIFNHHQFRNVVVDGEDADDFLIFIADIDGRRFEDAAVFSLGQITRMVLEFVGLAAQGIEDGHGRAIADFAVGDVAVFNGYNGIFFVIIAQVMDDDFTVWAELVSQAFGQMA